MHAGPVSSAEILQRNYNRLCWPTSASADFANRSAFMHTCRNPEAVLRYACMNLPRMQQHALGARQRQRRLGSH